MRATMPPGENCPALSQLIFCAFSMAVINGRNHWIENKQRKESGGIRSVTDNAFSVVLE
jgi:hypothetical protein